jgi:hypothetical protein
MGAKSEVLAKQFEAKAQEAASVLEELSDADWKKVTEAEKWTVGVTAHHLARAFEAVAGIVTSTALDAPGVSRHEDAECSEISLINQTLAHTRLNRDDASTVGVTPRPKADTGRSLAFAYRKVMECPARAARPTVA